MYRLLLIALVCCFPLQALSASDFRCKPLDAESLNLETGKLSPVPGMVDPGEEFVVNRQSGQITGGRLTNTMSGQMPEVYDHMPDQNSFKAVTTYKPNFTVDYLEIHTHSGTAEMPFLYKSAWGLVVTGLCRYY